MIKQTTSRVIFFPRTLTSGEEYVNEEQWLENALRRRRWGILARLGMDDAKIVVLIVTGREKNQVKKLKQWGRVMNRRWGLPFSVPFR